MGQSNSAQVGLVVEDANELREMIAKALSKDGTVVRQATNGESAAKMLERESNVTFILSDIQMPKMDGMEFLKWVRARSPITMFIAMSGSIDAKKVTELAAAGADGVLLKPFTMQVLLKELDSAKSRHELKHAASSRPNQAK